MADTLAITVSADTAAARAELALLQDSMRSLQRQMRETAAAANASGIGAVDPKLTALAVQYEQVERRIGGVRGELNSLRHSAEESESGLGNLGAESKHVIAIFDEFSRGAHGQMIGSIVALTRDSGVLAKTIGALAGPFGIAMGAGLAFAGALYEIVHAAVSAREALDGVYNAALVSGRDSLGAVAQTKAMATVIGSTGLVGGGKSLGMAAALEAIPNASERAKLSLASVYDAWTRIQFGGNAEEAAKQIPKMFESITSMRELVDKNRLLTGPAYQEFAQAAGEKDVGRAAELLAQGIRQRYLRAAQEMANEARDTTSGFASALGAQTGAVMGPTVYRNRLPGPLTLPSREEMDANRAIAEGNKLEYERLGLLRQVKEIQDQVAAHHVGAAEGNPAIKRLQDQAAEIARRETHQAGTADPVEQLHAAMKAAEAAAAAHAKTMASARTAMLQADIATLRQGLANTRLTAAQRLSLQSELSGKQADLSLAGLREHGSGARGGATAARQDYEAFAAEEREKLAAARGNAGAQAAILDQWRAKAVATFQAGSAAYREAMATIERAAQEMAAQTIEAMERAEAAMAHANTSILHGFEAQMQTRVARRQISPQQAYGFDIEETYALGAQQKAALDRIMGSAAATPQQRTNAYWQEWDLGTQLQAQISGLTAKAAEAGKAAAAAFTAPFRGAFSRVGGSLEAALTGALTGEKGKRIWQSLDRALVGSGVNLVTGTASRIAAIPLGGLLGQAVKPGQGVGDVLGGAVSSWAVKGLASLFPSVGKMFGQTTQDVAQTANTTALTALTTAVAANTAALTAASATSTASAGSSALSAAGSAGGLLGGVKTIGGWLGFAKGGVVPAAAGGWVVPAAAGGWSLPPSFGSDRVMAALTPGEMVLPTHLSDGLQQMIGAGPGGDFHAHFHGPSDAPQMARFFRNNRRHIVDAVRGAFHSGALNPMRV